jgi:hypothetical protein
VIDGHLATLAWIGGVYGHRVKALGVEHFGQTGTRLQRNELPSSAENMPVPSDIDPGEVLPTNGISTKWSLLSKA